MQPGLPKTLSVAPSCRLTSPAMPAPTARALDALLRQALEDLLRQRCEAQAGRPIDSSSCTRSLRKLDDWQQGVLELHEQASPRLLEALR